MRRAATLLAAAAMLGITALSAQATNFSGTWTPVVDPNAQQMGGGRGGAGPMTITQDAKTLTITRTTPNGEFKTVYNLDGSESKNTQGQNEVVSVAKWDGAKLVITTAARNSTAVYSLDAAGNLLIATTQPPRGGGDPTTNTRTYKKG